MRQKYEENPDYELSPFEEWQLETHGNILPNYSREQDEQDFRFPTTQELNYFFSLENNAQ